MDYRHVVVLLSPCGVVSERFFLHLPYRIALTFVSGLSTRMLIYKKNDIDSLATLHLLLLCMPISRHVWLGASDIAYGTAPISL